MGSMGAVRDFQSWSRKQSAPATIAIVALMVLSSIYFWVTHGDGMASFEITGNWLKMPWQLITYPFAYLPLADALSFMFFVCIIAWMIFAGMAIERELGWVRYVVLWLVMSAAPALLIGIYSQIRGLPFAFGGPFLPIEGLTILWCTRFASQSILVYGFIPMTGKWLAWLTVAMVFFLYGAMRPEFGILASIPLVIPWMYASDRIPNFAYGRYGGRTREQNLKRTERADKKYFEDVRRREQEGADRERLRKLFENSMKDEPGDR